MGKKFKVDVLSVSSIKDLQKQLQDYSNSMNKRCEELCIRLAKLGIPVIESNINSAHITYDEKGIESGSDTTHHTSVKVQSFGDYAHVDLIVEGKDLLFIEFGSGIYHNAPPGESTHPRGKEFGYVIGSYGKGNGVQKVWGYYDDNGEFVLTHGTEATMPMYKASKEIANSILKVAKDIFGK